MEKGTAMSRAIASLTPLTLIAVVAVDTASATVRGYATVGREPHVATFTPDGREAWVTVRGEAYLAIVDPQTLEVTARVPSMPGPSMV
jgi:DNA-binding beta-propeller fold protein YncE